MAFSKTAAFDFLRRAHEQNRFAHACLITGPAGSGKRELAARLASLLVDPSTINHQPSNILQHPDVHTAEPESKSRRIVIGQIRGLEKELQMRSTRGGKKVGIIFEADRLQIQASNAFLKTLEEPPNNSLLLLTSAQPEMLPDTILSRCMAVPLNAIAQEDSPLEKQLLKTLQDYFQANTAGLPQIYGLVRQCTQLLQETRQQIQGEHDAEFKKEETLYKKTTDSDWLDDRENYYKALTESRYIQQRFVLVDTLIQWWADVLRHQQGCSRLDQPGYAADTAKLATKFTTQQALQRIGHLEELRENFNRSVQEPLAIEVAFLKAFA